MDLTVIILIIVLIVILYLFYIYFIASSSQVVSTVYLNKSASPTTITDSPSAVSFSIACWIYVNSWSTTSSKNIYCLLNDQGQGIVSLDLGQTAPTLTTTVYASSGNPTTIDITDNFPLQRWVLSIVSISNGIVDCYLDGRLISSFQLPVGTMPPVQNAKTLTMNFATPANGVYTPVDIFIYGVNRYAYGMDPGTAQNLYYYNSPPATSSNNYNVILELEQNGQVSNSYKLF